MDFKKLLADYAEVSEDLILISPKAEMGDFCLPCFIFAKTLHKPPQEIAKDIMSKLETKKIDLVKKMDVQGGYLNFFLNKEKIALGVMDDIVKNGFNPNQIGKGKTVCIDYCSANLAKYLHIGHFSTTIIGESLNRIYTALGYNVVKINFIGDYGTPFGKMVVAFQLWGDLKDIENRGIDAVQELYVKFASNETDELMEKARYASKRIEDKVGEEYEIYKRIIAVSLDECKRVINKLGITFDDWNGESYYDDKIDSIIQELKEKHLLQTANEGVGNINISIWNTFSMKPNTIEKPNNNLIKPITINLNGTLINIVPTKIQETDSSIETKTIQHNISIDYKKTYDNEGSIVDLTKFGLGIAIIQRSDGASMYITRDLCAIEDRYKNYKFDEMLYVVAVQQKMHFSQLFKICELMGHPYAKNLKHISFGMFSTPEGKIASRKGKQALLVDILAQAEANAFNVIKDKTFEIEDKQEIAQKVARSSIAFSVLKVERNKDKIFEMDKAISFDGETAPYLQYTYARCCSLKRKFEKIDEKIQKNQENQEILNNNNDFLNIIENNFELIKLISNLENIILDAKEKAEPYILARAVLDLCQQFNKLYNNVKFIDENNWELTTKLMEFVTVMQRILEKTMPLVVVDLIQEM